MTDTKPTRIVWMSRHTPTPCQLRDLKAEWPDHELLPDVRPFDSADDIIERFRKAQGDELLVVAPLSVVQAITKKGIDILWAEMRQVPCSDERVEVRIKNRCYRFISFKRVAGIKIITKPLHPTKEQ